MHNLKASLLAFTCLILFAVSFAPFANGGQSPARGPYEQDAYFDFRDARRLQEPLLLFGPDVQSLAHTERGGLRFTIPANRPKLDPVGVAMPGSYRGDFEITAGYEILQTTKPNTGGGVGFEIYIGTFNPTDDAIAYTRVTRPKSGEVYFCTRMTTKGGKRQYAFQEHPASTNRGWLRLTRRGSEVAFLASENPAGPYLEIWRNIFVPDNLQLIRLAAYSGGDPAPFDMRLLDLRVRTTRANSLPPSEDRTFGALGPPDEASAIAPHLATSVIVFCAFVGLLLTTLAIWLFVRFRRSSLSRVRVDAQSVPGRSRAWAKGEMMGRPIGRFPILSMIGVTLLIAACSAYANCSFAVADGANYAYFPPFKPYADANMNRHLGAEYFNIARSLSAGEGFSNPFRERTGPTAWMPPIFPFLLAALLWLCNGHLGPVVTVVVFVQVLVLVGTGFLVLCLVRRTAGRLAAAIAGVVYCVALLIDFHMHFQMTHDCWLILLAMDVLLAGFCWARPLSESSSAVLWGIFGGLSALVNPVVAFVWAGMTTMLASRQRAWACLAWAGLAAACTILPWTVRNFAVFGRLMPIKSNLAYELYQSQCLQSDGLIQLQTFATHPYGKPGPERSEYKEKGETAFLDGKREEFWQSVNADPLSLADKVAHRLLGATVLYVPFDRNTESMERPFTFLFSRLIYPLPFISLLVLLSAGFFRRLHPAQWMVMGIYVCYLVPYIAISYYDRYAVPLLAIKTLLVIWVVDLLFSLWRKPCAPAN